MENTIEELVIAKSKKKRSAPNSWKHLKINMFVKIDELQTNRTHSIKETQTVEELRRTVEDIELLAEKLTNKRTEIDGLNKKLEECQKNASKTNEDINKTKKRSSLNIQKVCKSVAPLL